MKTQIYNGDWQNRSDMMNDFEIEEEDLVGCTILYAWYEYEDYSGSAVVIFEKLGQLYEVNAGHCSCYGLEGQWEPEETSLESLRNESHWNLSSAPDSETFIENLIKERLC